MALTCRAFYRNCNFIRSITKPVKLTVEINNQARVLASGICYQTNFNSPLHDVKVLGTTGSFRTYSTQEGNCPKTPQVSEEPKPGLIKRFKQMYRDYWYVLLPVHLATSAVWFGTAYYVVRRWVTLKVYQEKRHDAIIPLVGASLPAFVSLRLSIEIVKSTSLSLVKESKRC